MSSKPEAASSRGGVADYFAVLGVGEKLVWQHTQKKIGLVHSEEKQDDEEDEAALMERFYREIVEVAIVVTDLSIDAKGTGTGSLSRAASYADDATISSHANSISSVHTPAGKPRHATSYPQSPPFSDATTFATHPESASQTRREFVGFTTIHNTAPAGRSSKDQDQSSVSSSFPNESISRSASFESIIWSKSQVFDANLDPCFGFRREVLSRVALQGTDNTTLKDLGRKVGTTLRHQLGPLLPSRDRLFGRSISEFAFHLAFRRRAPDEKDRPAISDLGLRYVRFHRDTLISSRSKPLDANSDSGGIKSAALRRGLATSANIAARVAEASRQRLIDKYRERYDTSSKGSIAQRREDIQGELSDTILVAVEDLVQLPDGFEQWSIPDPFRWVQIPSRAKKPMSGSSSVGEGRKTHVFPYRTTGYPGSETHVFGDEMGTQGSDPSGIGIEAYFDGSSFVLTPPSSAAGASDIGIVRPSSPAQATSVLVAEHDDHELTTSFEVLDPGAFMPLLLEIDQLPDLSGVTSGDPYTYVPVLAMRRQCVGDEERYHEDTAVVDLTVSFCDTNGDVVLPDLSQDNDLDEEEEGFNLLGATPWSTSSRIENSQQRPTDDQLKRLLGSPLILAKRNNPIGFADAAFATKVLDRFPVKNYKGLPLPEEELPMFCYPTGCRLYRARYSDCPLPQSFGFVVKNERGDSIHVSCVSFMEPLSHAKTEQLSDMSYRRRRVSIPHRRFSKLQRLRNHSESVREDGAVGTCIDHHLMDDEEDLLTGFDEMTTFENKTICLISRYPFWTAFRRFLSHLHIMSGSPSDLPVERYISHLLLSVPLPKSGGPCVLVPLPGLNCPMILAAPPNKDLPLVDLPFHRLFACLNVHTVVTIVVGLLALERKLLVISTRPSLVLDVCELLKALLFPFELCAPYVPRLTEPFVSCLEFPGAIFVGIHDDGTKEGLASMVRSDLPEDSAIVDLDTGEIDCSGDRYEVLKQCWRIIPPGPRAMLVSEIETLCRDAGIVPGQEPLDSQVDAAFDVSVASAGLVEDMNDTGHAHREPLDDRAVRDAFLRFFTSVLAGYERFLVPPDLDFKTSGSEWFDTQGFLAAASPEQAPFLGSIVGTQLFQLFIQRRTESSDVHCLLFDECLAEYHSAPIPYGRLGGDVEAVPSPSDGPPQMLYSLLVDQCCAESHQQVRGGSFDQGGDNSDTVHIPSPRSDAGSGVDTFVNEDGDLVTTPTRTGLLPLARFVYFSDGNPCFPQQLNSDLFRPGEPDSLLVDLSETPLPLLTRSEREVEDATRRRKTATSYRGLRNHSRCLWQLPKLMGSHFLGSWLLCIPSQVSQKGLASEIQSRYLLRALGAMRLLRNRQRIIPDEASYRAVIVACGCVAGDRRVELGKLFGLLRNDNIFPSAVTLGQYTRALAEGYSKQIAEVKEDSSGTGVEVTVAGSSERKLLLEEKLLSSLDSNIAMLEESGRRWRTRLSQNRETDADADTNSGHPGQEGNTGSAASSRGKKKKRHVQRSWHPVSTSSSFVPATTDLQPSDVIGRIEVVAIWSRTTACPSCAYIPLDEEIQSGWDVVVDEVDSQNHISCPRCGSMMMPKLGYRETSVNEAAREGKVQENQGGDNVDPPQINPSVESVKGNYVRYISPAAVRSRLEHYVEEHGESILERETLQQLDTELFYNLWWYCARFSLPLPLPVSHEDRTDKPNYVMKHRCAFVAWDVSTAEHGCRTASQVMIRIFAGSDGQENVPSVASEADITDEDFPLLSQFKLQNVSKGDWDHVDLSRVLVTLVEACDKRDFKPVVECALECINRRRKVAGESTAMEMDCYRVLLYLAKYQCTTAFHVFFPAATKPCKGYHFWCALGTPLPIFDRMFRDAVKRIKTQENLVTQIHDVSDVALGFRCVFGHII